MQTDCRSPAWRRLVQLENIELPGFERLVDQRIAWIDENPDPANMVRNPNGELAGTLETDIAGTRREEHEADMARPALDCGIDRFGRCEPAYLGLDRHGPKALLQLRARRFQDFWLA